MKTYSKFILPAIIIIFLNSCNSGYVTYKARTKNTLELYNTVVKANDDSTNFDNFKRFYHNKCLYGKQKYKHNKNITNTAFNLLVFQNKNINKINKNTTAYFEKYFRGKCCGNDKIIVLVRKLIDNTFASHLSTIHRKDSYVFYFLYDYNPETGLGMYFQTDAYYPRDAFSFRYSDFCPDSGRIEFYNGIFMLTSGGYKQKDVLCLMGPQNEMNDRKEFEIDINGDNITFTKRYEYKQFNYYPIIQGNYEISSKGELNPGETTLKLFQEDFDILDSLVEGNAKSEINEVQNTVQKKSDSVDTDEAPFRDYFYPCKATNGIVADNGWVYFGSLRAKKNNWFIRIFKENIDTLVVNETFFAYSDWSSSNKQYFKKHMEFRNMKQLEKRKQKNKRIRCFDVIKVRNSVPLSFDVKTNFTDPNIIGEALPKINYYISEIDTIPYKNNIEIWLKIRQ